VSFDFSLFIPPIFLVSLRGIKSGQSKDTRHGKLNKELKRWDESRVNNQETQYTENSTKKLKRWEESRVENQETQDTKKQQRN
jgi:hypothetical protein